LSEVAKAVSVCPMCPAEQKLHICFHCKKTWAIQYHFYFCVCYYMFLYIWCWRCTLCHTGSITELFHRCDIYIPTYGTNGHVSIQNSQNFQM